MNNSTFVGRHGFEVDRLSAIHDPLRDPAGQIAERVVAALLVACNVDKEVHTLSHPLGADEADNELERSKRFASPSNQQTGVLAVDLDDRAVHLLVVRLLEVNRDYHFHLLDQVFEHLGGDASEVGWLLDERNTNPCRLPAYAEDARLAATNDVDFDLAALGV